MNRNKPRGIKDCGLVVKQWMPAEGCPNCKRARQLFDEHMRISGHNQALAIKKIRSLMAEIEELKNDHDRLIGEGP